ncbi:MAG: PIN domain-containing protein [Actinomycetota bacterium]
MRFWDSSAVVPLLVRQAASDRAEAELRSDGHMVVWWATSVECLSAISRQERAGSVDEATAARARRVLGNMAGVWTEVGPTEDVRELAGRLLRRHALRAADALQLAAALAWAETRPHGHEVCVLDGRLADAAGLEGLEIALGP